MRARWDGQLGMKEATLAPPKSSRFRALGCTSAILVVGCGLFSSELGTGLSILGTVPTLAYT